jgi:hypothetical protein
MGHYFDNSAMIVIFVNSQPLKINWQHCYGGSNNEWAMFKQ